LRLTGFRVLARRFATPVGEIDLIARRGRLLIFVEVKRRADLAAAGEALQPRQQQRIARAAEVFLQRRPALRGLECRFDVVAVAPWRWPRHVQDVWRP
jgi:putative endonuclease